MESAGQHGFVNILAHFHRFFEGNTDAGGDPVPINRGRKRSDGPALSAPVHVLNQAQQHKNVALGHAEGYNENTRHEK